MDPFQPNHPELHHAVIPWDQILPEDREGILIVQLGDLSSSLPPSEYKFIAVRDVPIGNTEGRVSGIIISKLPLVDSTIEDCDAQYEAEKHARLAIAHRNVVDVLGLSRNRCYGAILLLDPTGHLTLVEQSSSAEVGVRIVNEESITRAFDDSLRASEQIGVCLVSPSRTAGAIAQERLASFRNR